MAKKSSYSAEDITVLEGLDPVRKRPAMYIGGTDKTGYHHLLWEIVDNCIDEVIGKFADTIHVTLKSDQKTMIVSDNGRGIPVDVLKKQKKSALEVIMTTLHAGGKFDQGQAYSTSGGLHGVGASVVNALSSSMTVSVSRDGHKFEQAYSRGVAQSTVKKTGKSKRTGTTITFEPDEEIFGKKSCFDTVLIQNRLQSKSYLHRNLTIVFVDETQPKTYTYHHENGIVDYVNKLIAERGQPTVPPKAPPLSFIIEHDIPIECAMQWTESTEESIRSYVNGIPTTSGGTHDLGFKNALVKALRNYITTHKLSIKGVSLTADDIREGIIAVLSIYVENPQFQGQTKDRLNNPEVQSKVDTALRPAFESYFNENPTTTEAIVARTLLSAQARIASRKAAQSVSRAGGLAQRLNLPGKLADCSASNPAIRELFIVEGDSAGGSAKQGRDRHTQAILPLRGKVLNTEQASKEKVVANKELQNIISALGSGFGNTFDISKLRYHRIFLLMDADADGHHITTLLLAFFYRHMHHLITAGHLYLAQPPLYRIDIGKKTWWALDDMDQQKILKQHATKTSKPNITRFKGLGEMSPSILKETTLEPKHRNTLRITIGDQEKLSTNNMFVDLLGKDSSARSRFVSEHSLRLDDIDL